MGLCGNQRWIPIHWTTWDPLDRQTCSQSRGRPSGGGGIVEVFFDRKDYKEQMQPGRLLYL